jgi:hypothetical protein
MILYKYTKKEHLLAFKEKGEVLINTLSNLREKYEPIGDEAEGKTKILVGSQKEEMTLSLEELHKPVPAITIPKGYKGKGNIQIVMEKGAIIDYTEFVPDAFIFSTSLHRNKEFLRHFKEYDVYYKIVKPERYADIVYEKLNEKFSIVGFRMGRVKYLNKKLVLDTREKVTSFKQDPDKFWSACFTKTLDYSYQVEFRMVFVPSIAKGLEKQIIQSLDLTKCCAFT